MNKEKQLAFDKRYLRMAQIWAENSYAIKRQVGCLIVKDNSIISDGYNGTPSGFENVCEEAYCNYYSDCADKVAVGVQELETCKKCKHVKLVTKPYVLHAEANAISKLAKGTNHADGATLYVTDAPCLECSKMIIQCGIRRVVYSREYHTNAGKVLLKRAGIIVEQISI